MKTKKINNETLYNLLYQCKIVLEYYSNEDNYPNSINIDNGNFARTTLERLNLIDEYFDKNKDEESINNVNLNIDKEYAKIKDFISQQKM